MGKVAPFSSPVQLLHCNERFHQRAGSLNPQALAIEEGDVASSSSLIAKNKKIGKQAIGFPWVKCPRSHSPCIYYVAMSVSSDALEASICV